MGLQGENSAEPSFLHTRQSGKINLFSRNRHQKSKASRAARFPIPIDPFHRFGDDDVPDRRKRLPPG